MTPLPISEGRIDKACFVGSYRGGPRELLLRQAERQFGLDRFGGSGQKFDGAKAAVLERYTFCAAAENSFGFGYDTEKLPEAWDSGCVPVGTFLQPLSDFNPLAISPDNPLAAHEHPLLLEAPSADRILGYLQNLL